MISRDTWAGLVLRECPNFETYWADYQDYWARAGSPGVCLEISAFGDFVKDRIVEGDSDEIARLFQLIEHLIAFGDGDVRNAAMTCCLENILNVTPSQLPAERFVRFLGPKSREFCRAWDEFTGVKTPGL